MSTLFPLCWLSSPPSPSRVESLWKALEKLETRFQNDLTDDRVFLSCLSILVPEYLTLCGEEALQQVRHQLEVPCSHVYSRPFPFRLDCVVVLSVVTC